MPNSLYKEERIFIKFTKSKKTMQEFMQKIDQFLTNHGMKTIAGILILFFINQCSTNSTIQQVEKELVATQKQVDSLREKNDSLEKRLSNKIVGRKELDQVLNEAPHWELLRIEQLADKKQLPIKEIQMKNLHKESDK